MKKDNKIERQRKYTSIPNTCPNNKGEILI